MPSEGTAEGPAEGPVPAPVVSLATRHVMQANRSVDTKPELRVRQALRERGLPGYRLHWKKAPGRPDVCYPGRRLAIFVNGCYWHHCAWCQMALPKSNVEFWRQKFARNRARDVRDANRLASAGWTVLVVVLLAVAMYIYLKYTKQGYEIAVVGDSENTARYAGIRVNRIYVRTMAISGAICGFAGFLAVASVSHTISTSTANGRGFTAIIVAWLAKMNPFVMILISALLTFLDKGAIQIASDYGLNEYASQIISGITLFFILGSEFFINYKVKFRGQK